MSGSQPDGYRIDHSSGMLIDLATGQVASPQEAAFALRPAPARPPAAPAMPAMPAAAPAMQVQAPGAFMPALPAATNRAAQAPAPQGLLSPAALYMPRGRK